MFNWLCEWWAAQAKQRYDADFAQGYSLALSLVDTDANYCEHLRAEATAGLEENGLNGFDMGLLAAVESISSIDAANQG